MLNRNGLQKRSCECYAVVKKEYDRLLRRRSPPSWLSQFVAAEDPSVLTDLKFASVVATERKDPAQQLGGEPEIQVIQRIREAFVTGGVQAID